MEKLKQLIEKKGKAISAGLPLEPINREIKDWFKGDITDFNKVADIIFTDEAERKNDAAYLRRCAEFRKQLNNG